jgi:hypothetical protein
MALTSGLLLALAVAAAAGSVAAIVGAWPRLARPRPATWRAGWRWSWSASCW